MKKVVLKVDVQDEKTKRKAMKAVSGLSGLQSLSVNSKDKKLTATGDIDPVSIVSKLRKFLHAEIESVEEDGDNDKKDPNAEYLKIYQETYHPAFAYRYYPYYPCYYFRSAEEHPNSCVIC